jgi:hypothetical protein
MAPHHDTDFSGSRDFGADLRFLSSDEGSALSAWVGAAIAMIGMLLAACTIGGAAFLYQRHRNRSVTREVQKVQVNSADNGGKKGQAWSDPEMGGETIIDKASLPIHNDSPVVPPEKLSPSVKFELAETLRNILEDEISRGLKASGISDRLDRLEQQQKEQQVLSGAMLPPSTKSGGASPSPDLVQTAKAQALYGSSTSDWDATIKPEDGHLYISEKKEKEQEARIADLERQLQERSQQLQQSQAQLQSDQGAQTTTPDSLRPRASAPDNSRKDLTLSASKRQRGNQDPPERGWVHIPEDRSLRASLITVQKKLQQRDLQTQELHRQLRATEQDHWNQKREASFASKRLLDLLSDPSHAPKVQAEELKGFRNRVDDLSSRLADSKQSETQWQIVAKRQRAFFMQSERVAQEGVNLFRKHPAGELFLAPPPVYLEDDIDEDPRKPLWDVGNSHINPYANDSWPFEPNACAQRCAVEPNLSRWDEEDDDIVDSLHSDSEDGSPGSADRSIDDPDRARLMLRLPSLPPQSPHDQDFEPPEPSEPPEPLPCLGALSSRSL